VLHENKRILLLSYSLNISFTISKRNAARTMDITTKNSVPVM
jgi:hypothetical protein